MKIIDDHLILVIYQVGTVGYFILVCNHDSGQTFAHLREYNY